jgi:hypothetical protein
LLANARWHDVSAMYLRSAAGDTLIAGLVLQL